MRMEEQIEVRTNKPTDRHTGSWNVDRQPNRETERQTDRQVEKRMEDQL